MASHKDFDAIGLGDVAARGDSPAPRLPLTLPVAIGWLLLVVLWITWSPPALRPRAVLPTFGSTADLRVMALNLFLLVPLGIAVGAACARRRRARFTAALTIAAVPVIIEVGQMWIHNRNPYVIDWLLNSVGGVTAAWIVIVAAGSDLRRRLLVVGAVGVTAVGVAALALGSGVRIHELTALRNWSPAFEIHSGDEIGGARAYVGSVSGAVICAGGPEPTVCASPGADAAERRGLTDRALRSQEVLARARIVSAGAQTGPARIVTFSAGPGERNITLGQEAEDLILRIRTPLHGPNGSTYAYRLPSAAPPGSPTDVTAYFQEGVVELRATGSHGTRTARFRFTPLTAWLSLHAAPTITSGLLHRAAVIGAAVLFLPVGFAAGRTRPGRPVLAAGVAFLAGLALLAAASLLPGVHLVGRDVLLTALFSALGALIAGRAAR